MESSEYDIQSDRARLTETLKGSEEIDRLTGLINIGDMNSIVTFGADAAERIRETSDSVLRSVRVRQTDDSGELLNTLAGLMNRFDINELEGDISLLTRLFGGAKRQLDKTLEKYGALDAEVDRIFARLRKYEAEISRTGRALEDMFRANVDTYHELVKYILAAEQGCREIEIYLEQRRRDRQTTGDQSIEFEILTLEQALRLLKQRAQDLKTAEIVAMQSIPMIRLMQYNNLQLVQKINSAFIVTMPVFKQALSQAILMKRQSMQAEALSRLDKRTGELLKRSARADDTQKTDSLRASWNAIMSGITETRELQTDNDRRRQEAAERLQAARQKNG